MERRVWKYIIKNNTNLDNLRNMSTVGMNLHVGRMDRGEWCQLIKI